MKTLLQSADEQRDALVDYGMLEAYAAAAAVEVLIANWRDAIRDGSDKCSDLLSDVDDTIKHLREFRDTVKREVAS